MQWLLPTWFLRLLVRLYLRYSGGPAMRGGDVVIKQIHVDSQWKAAAQRLRPFALQHALPAPEHAEGGLQPRPAAASWQVFWLAGHTGLLFRTGGHGRAE